MKSTEFPINRMVLLSNNICYGPRPEAETEVEQRLTLVRDGKAFITRYRYGDGNRFERLPMQRKRLQPEQMMQVMGWVQDVIINRDPLIDVTDVGRWALTIFYRDGERAKYEGPLIPDDNGKLTHLSDAIREALDCPDLFAFDGRAAFVLEQFE